MNAESDDAAVERLLERIRQRITPGSVSRDDDELLARFNPLPRRDTAVGDQMLEHVERLRRLRQSLPPFADTSRVPGGRYLHRLIGRSVRRDAALLAAQIDALRDQIADSLQVIVEGVQESLDQLWASNQQTASLIELHDHPANGFRPGFSALDFADRFRGRREDLLLRYADVADLLLTGGGPVLDIGCGRGELIELIVTKGGTARGVDIDAELVEFCRSIYLDVVQREALGALSDEEDATLGGVSLIQVVEHLSPQELADLAPLAWRKLKPGGLFVAETVNGTSPFVFTRSFYCDPTHTNPVHHEYLGFLLERSGFTESRIEWRSLVDSSDRLSEISDEGEPVGEGSHDRLVKEMNCRIQQLNRHLFGPQDYLIVARK